MYEREEDKVSQQQDLYEGEGVVVAMEMAS